MIKMTDLKYLERARRDNVTVNREKLARKPTNLDMNNMTNYEKCELKIALAEARRRK